MARSRSPISSDGSVYLWDVFSSKRLARPLQYEVGVEDCLFNPDGSKSCSDAPTARLGFTTFPGRIA